MTDVLTAVAGATGDAAILAAWNRRKAAYRAMNALERDQGSDTSPVSAEKQRLLSEIDAAEEVLISATATTPAGAAAQLWTGLYHTLNSMEADEDAAVLQGDIDYLESLGKRLDWDTRLIVAGLRSLRAMEASHGC